jgi:ribosomal protein S27AE
MPAREDGLTVRSCPRCGATVWNRLVDWRKRVGFSVSHVACGSCGLTAMEVGIDAAIVPNQIQERDAQIVIAANDVEIEYVEPKRMTS